MLSYRAIKDMKSKLTKTILPDTMVKIETSLAVVDYNDMIVSLTCGCQYRQHAHLRNISVYPIVTKEFICTKCFNLAKTVLIHSCLNVNTFIPI